MHGEGPILFDETLIEKVYCRNEAGVFVTWGNSFSFSTKELFDEVSLLLFWVDHRNVTFKFCGWIDVQRSELGSLSHWDAHMDIFCGRRIFNFYFVNDSFIYDTTLLRNHENLLAFTVRQNSEGVGPVVWVRNNCAHIVVGHLSAGFYLKVFQFLKQLKALRQKSGLAWLLELKEPIDSFDKSFNLLFSWHDLFLLPCLDRTHTFFVWKKPAWFE